MRAVVQRVRRASVSVAGECVGKIERGLLLLIGIELPMRRATLTISLKNVLNSAFLKMQTAR